MYKRSSFIYLFAFLIAAALLNRLSAAGITDTSFIDIRDRGVLLKVINEDTIRRKKLDSVVVSAGFKRGTMANRGFAVGTNVISATPESISKAKVTSLAGYLRESSAVYLKEYGRGMGAFISVRGTSSSHTSVSWNGMNMSIPTLGQTDLSHIPVYFFDKMDLHIGGGSALYGDGSLGGSIQLNTSPLWINGVSGDILISGGSFSTLFTGATVRYSNKRTESRTSLFRSSAKNNYYFKNNTKYGLPVEKLNNAAFENIGIMQELHHKLKDSSIISFNVWLLDFDREIQPSVSLNDRPESYASIIDRNLRTSISYSGSSSSTLSYNAKIAYSYDYEKYKNDIIAASRYLLNSEIQYARERFILKGGASAEQIVPTVESYEGSVREGRGYIYLLTRYNLFQNLTVSAGVRAGGVTNSTVPVMPSADILFTPVRRSGHTLSIRASVSKNSKVPSLNDRYWGGVHTYLKSERSSTIEGGADYSLVRDYSELSFFATLYKSRVDDWIRWLPAGQVWRPQNIPEVLSRGGEVGLLYSIKLNELKISGSFNYNYTDIRMIKALRSEESSLGRQLAYQPRHSLRSGINAQWGDLSAFITLSYTGERTTLDIYDIMPSYLLTDIGLDYNINICDKSRKNSGSRLVLSPVVRNIFNVSYQNVKFYAMAGRSWQISLRWNF
ncbi:MAG: TonB-dependent receptor plug domain-containing protein [Bacteroidales bacterium]|nr:TonB-dependent receptor plug domain-containing protein [Bacteroidales bacterium]